MPTPAYRGAVLAPWPNRIRDGRYTFDGEQHQLAVNEVERGTALHGLTLWCRWSVSGHCATELTLDCLIAPRPGYPFALTTSTRFHLDEAAGLTSRSLRPTSDRERPLTALPFIPTSGRAPRPWTTGRRCSRRASCWRWTSHRPAAGRQHPGGGHPVRLQPPRSLARESLDHAFTGLRFDGSVQAGAELRGADGFGVRVGWGADCGWVQVYTLDQPGHPMHRGAVAIEPMTCAPDAFNSGEGLLVLAPGAHRRTAVGWVIPEGAGPVKSQLQSR